MESYVIEALQRDLGHVTLSSESLGFLCSEVVVGSFESSRVRSLSERSVDFGVLRGEVRLVEVVANLDILSATINSTEGKGTRLTRWPCEFREQLRSLLIDEKKKNPKKSAIHSS